MTRLAAAFVLAGVLVLALDAAVPGAAQDSDMPREFSEFRGTWTLDETATEGLRLVATRTGRQLAIDPLGMPVARQLVIATSPTDITLTKDDGLPELYRFDGTESQTRDPRTNIALDHRYSFALVAGTLALTSKFRGDRHTEIITDAYSLPSWDVLRVERQLSYLTPDGRLRTLSGVRNHPQTLVYRRN